MPPQGSPRKRDASQKICLQYFDGKSTDFGKHIRRIAPNLEDTGKVTVIHTNFRKVRYLTRTIVDREGIQYVYFWDYLWLSDIPIYQCFDACKTNNIFQHWLAYSSNQQQHWTITYQPILQQVCCCGWTPYHLMKVTAPVWNRQVGAFYGAIIPPGNLT